MARTMSNTKADWLEEVKQVLINKGLPLHSIRIVNEGIRCPNPGVKGPFYITLTIEGEILNG